MENAAVQHCRNQRVSNEETAFWDVYNQQYMARPTRWRQVSPRAWRLVPGPFDVLFLCGVGWGSVFICYYFYWLLHEAEAQKVQYRFFLFVCFSLYKANVLDIILPVKYTSHNISSRKILCLVQIPVFVSFPQTTWYLKNRRTNKVDTKLDNLSSLFIYIFPLRKHRRSKWYFW